MAHPPHRAWLVKDRVFAVLTTQWTARFLFQARDQLAHYGGSVHALGSDPSGTHIDYLLVPERHERTAAFVSDAAYVAEAHSLGQLGAAPTVGMGWVHEAIYAGRPPALPVRLGHGDGGKRATSSTSAASPRKPPTHKEQPILKHTFRAELRAGDRERFEHVLGAMDLYRWEAGSRRQFFDWYCKSFDDTQTPHVSVFARLYQPLFEEKHAGFRARRALHRRGSRPKTAAPPTPKSVTSSVESEEGASESSPLSSPRKRKHTASASPAKRVRV